jgi:hypothetical protein
MADLESITARLICVERKNRRLHVAVWVTIALVLLLGANLVWAGLRLGRYAEIRADRLLAEQTETDHLSVGSADRSQPAKDIDLAQALGSDGGVSTQRFTIYVPSKDRNGKEINDQRKWVVEAVRLLSEINGGSTATPPVEGGWLNDQGELVWEKSVLVYSFIRPDEFKKTLPRLREFLHRLGRETNQGEVAIEFEGRFYRIQTFDPRRG